MNRPKLRQVIGALLLTPLTGIFLFILVVLPVEAALKGDVLPLCVVGFLAAFLLAILGLYLLGRRESKP